jgi:hypothetical protein
MKNMSPKISEHRCPACNGTGFPTVTQPVQPGRKIYPVKCRACAGKAELRTLPTEALRKWRHVLDPATLHPDGPPLLGLPESQPIAPDLNGEYHFLGSAVTTAKCAH